jgi:agmatinase
MTDLTFLGLEPGECLYATSRVVILQVPYDGTVSYRTGARHGPRAIVEASQQVELLDLELGIEPWRVGLHLPPEMTFAGDEEPGRVVEQVAQACRSHVERGKRILLLGGEHSLTAGAVQAFERLPDTVLQVDAHLDLRESYEGSRHSHACVGRRLLELGVSLVHVGARVACPEELEVVGRHGLAPFWADDLHKEPDAEWIARAVSRLGERVYVSVDVDGLDPSVIPGTGTPVPGGLGWRQLLELLRAVGDTREVVGADLCELAPIVGQNVSEFSAALLAYKMIGYFWR